MSDTSCPTCGRPAGQGFACKVCAANARTNLAHVADLASQADSKRARMTTNWRSGTIGRAAAIPMPFDPRVSKVLDPIRVQLHAVGKAVIEDHPARLLDPHGYGEDLGYTDPRMAGLRPHSVASVANWLMQFTSWLRFQPDAPQVFDLIDTARANLMLLFDRPPDMIYVGKCNLDVEGVACTEPLYVEHGSGQAECRRCHAIHDVGDRRDELKAGVEDYLGTAREISALCNVTLGEDVSSKMIWYYAKTGLIQPHGERDTITKAGERRKAPLYRIGEVREAVRVIRGDERRHRKALRASLAS